MTALENAFDEAKKRRLRVVLPETQDPRIAEAAAVLLRDGLAEPVPLSEPCEAHVEALLSVRPMKEALARRMIAKPMFRAAAMVTLGEADGLVAGATSSTKRVIEAASIAIGMAEGVTLPSSFFLMILLDGREFVFADCAVNVAPDTAGLADIARASAVSATALLGRCEIALLSFSTLASGTDASVDRVRQATEILRAEGLTAVGPVQGDAALNPVIAANKGVAGGAANTLIFPSLDAGNIAYKLLQEMAGAQAVGPFLQGFRRPVCDLSRGASVDDIVAATAVTLAMG